MKLASWLRQIGMELNNDDGCLRCDSCGGTQPIPRLNDGRLALHGWRCIAGCREKYAVALTELATRTIRDPALRERVNRYLESVRE